MVCLNETQDSPLESGAISNLLPILGSPSKKMPMITRGEQLSAVRVKGNRPDSLRMTDLARPRSCAACTFSKFGRPAPIAKGTAAAVLRKERRDRPLQSLALKLPTPIIVKRSRG